MTDTTGSTQCPETGKMLHIGKPGPIRRSTHKNKRSSTQKIYNPRRKRRKGAPCSEEYTVSFFIFVFIFTGLPNHAQQHFCYVQHHCAPIIDNLSIAPPPIALVPFSSIQSPFDSLLCHVLLLQIPFLILCHCFLLVNYKIMYKRTIVSCPESLSCCFRAFPSSRVSTQKALKALLYSLLQPLPSTPTLALNFAN